MIPGVVALRGSLVAVRYAGHVPKTSDDGASSVRSLGGGGGETKGSQGARQPGR